MEISAATIDDLDQLVVMEQAATQYPWSKSALHGSMEQGHQIYLLKQDAYPAAYAVLLLLGDEAELLNFVVATEVQGQGVGSHFLAALLQSTDLSLVEQVHLEVRAANLAAIGLYQKLGFESVGLRKNYYPCASGAKENAVLMCWQRPE